MLISTAHSEHNACKAISTSSVLLAALNYAWLTSKPQDERNEKPGFSTTKWETHLPFKPTLWRTAVEGVVWKEFSQPWIKVALVAIYEQDIRGKWLGSWQRQI